MLNLKIRTNSHILYISILVIMFVSLSLVLLFFSGYELKFQIPAGPNAHKIWLVRTQYWIKTVISACAIGLSNYLVQLFTKNRLADTSVLGINSFHQLLVAILILIVPSFFAEYEQTYLFGIIYFVVALFSGIIFYFISINTNLTSWKIVIYGILVNVLLTAFSYFLLSSHWINPDLIKSRFIDYQNKVFGGINLSDDFSGVYFALSLFLICLISTFALKNRIIAQTSNYARMSSLGINNKRLRLYLILLISVLGSIVFFFIGFVAFLGISVSFVVNNMFKTFNQNVIGSILVSCIILLVSQFVQIVLSSTVASGISSTTIVGLTSFPIFAYFLIRKR